MEEGTTPQNNNNMMIMGAIVVLILLLVSGFFFMQSRGTSTVEPTTESTETMPAEETATEETTEATTSEETSADVQVVTMEAGSFYYKPNVINAKVGDKIKVVMNSVDMMHDFNIDELEVKIPITKSGETAEVEFTVDKAGTFEFYCSVGQHRKQGQVGTLTVTE